MHLPEAPIVEDVFDKQLLCIYFILSNMSLDLKTNKINSLNLLDKIQEEVENKFRNLEKLEQSLKEFE